jgi:SAM-dependent methyltransferase
MTGDAQITSQFYATSQGVVVARLLRARLAQMWPDASGMTVLGLGYAGPYLRPYLTEARTCLALTPAQTGVARWPVGEPCLSCTSEEDALPFPDLSFDRVLLVHGLEAAENARKLLREAWRVLKDDGRLLVVAPNRRGWWAHVDSTPFGQGQPYSPGQIGRLLKSSLFRIERRDTALFVPPMRLRLVLRGAPLWESTGRFLAPQFAGVTITEASKDLYSAIPVGGIARRRLVFTEAG